MQKTDMRILKLIDLLIFENKITNASQFCDSIGLYRQNLTSIKAGKQSFTIKHIESTCKKYNVNANWILGIQKNVYNGLKSPVITDVSSKTLPSM